jgi:hypothetical protein
MNRRNFLKTILVAILSLFGFSKKTSEPEPKKIPKEKIGWYIYEEPQIVILNHHLFLPIKD